MQRRPCIVDRTTPVTDPTAKYWSRIAVFAFDVPVIGALCRHIATTSGVEKLK